MENIIQVRNEYRKQQWTRIIQEYQNGGLSNKETVVRAFLIGCDYIAMIYSGISQIICKHFGQSLDFAFSLRYNIH